MVITQLSLLLLLHGKENEVARVIKLWLTVDVTRTAKLTEATGKGVILFFLISANNSDGGSLGSRAMSDTTYPYENIAVSDVLEVSGGKAISHHLSTSLT